MNLKCFGCKFLKNLVIKETKQSLMWCSFLNKGIFFKDVDNQSKENCKHCNGGYNNGNKEN